MVGLARFELASIAFPTSLVTREAPEATSLDQASRKPQLESLYPFSYGYSKPNQKATVTRVKRLSGLVVDLEDSLTVEKTIYTMNVKNNYKTKLFEAYQVWCKCNSIESADHLIRLEPYSIFFEKK